SIRKELKNQPDNTMLSMEAMNIEHQIALITKRRNDMITEQQKAFEDLKMMKMMKFNNLSMVDQFETIIKVTIPSSKRSHLIIDQAERSDKSSLLIQAIGDSVNQQARRQALLVKESSIRVAKTANRTVYDVETIDYISNQINEAGREIKKIHDRAKTQHTQLEARAAQWKEKRFMVAKELSSK
ncbi:tellurium resistance protein, partial [Citrobacter freundii]